MTRQYNVIYDDRIVGKFTIKCNRGVAGGWDAQAKYRNQHTAWSLEKQTDFVNKDDAIQSAYETIVAQSLQDKFTVEPVNKTEWSLV